MAGADGRTRVAFLTSTLGMGGAERHVELVARALRSAGHGIDVVCVEEAGRRAATLVAEGVPVVDLAAGDGWWLRAPSVVRRTVRQLRASRAGVVMTNGYSAEIVGRLAARIVGVPVIQWKHNIGHVGRFGLRDRWTERLLRPLSARVLAVSHAQVGYLTGFLRIPRERIGCIRNVLEPTFTVRAGAGPESGRPIVMCVAGFRTEKDHPTLLRAFREVVDVHPGAVLRLVGDGPGRPAAEALARELGIARSVEFLGARSDVAQLLPDADVFVLASYAVENLPFAVLEAMAARLPVVATDVGALSELVSDGVTGALVPPRDHPTLARALVRLVADPERARAMGRAGADRLRTEFSYDHFVAQLEEEVAGCG